MHPYHYMLQRIIWIRQSRLNLWRRRKRERSALGLLFCMFFKLSTCITCLVEIAMSSLLSLVHVFLGVLVSTWYIILQPLGWSWALVHNIRYLSHMAHRGDMAVSNPIPGQTFPMPIFISGATQGTISYGKNAILLSLSLSLLMTNIL
jgi:hypothetical protein